MAKYIKLKCDMCGCEFEKKEQVYKARRDKGQRLFFCGTGCADRHKSDIAKRNKFGNRKTL